MIYRTQGELLEFLGFVFCGMILGALYSFCFAKEGKKIVNVVKNLVFGSFSGIILAWCCWEFVRFEMNIIHILGIVMGGILCRFLCGKTLDSIFVWLYNELTKIHN